MAEAVTEAVDGLDTQEHRIVIARRRAGDG